MKLYIQIVSVTLVVESLGYFPMRSKIRGVDIKAHPYLQTALLQEFKLVNLALQGGGEKLVACRIRCHTGHALMFVAQ